MLVLSRQLDERIVIGDIVTVTVVEIRGNLVRLGIDAPREVAIHREEVHRVIQEQKEREIEAKRIEEAAGETS